MSVVAVNGYRVLDGRIEMPCVGVWVADLDVDIDDITPVTGAVTLALGDTLTLKGTTVTGAVYLERARIRVVGGAGGMGTPVAAKDYRITPASLPIRESLRQGGETLSASADAGKLASFFTSWTRREGTVGDALSHLVDAVGGVWRVLPDGSVWIGEETWPKTTAKNVLILANDPKAGRLLLDAEQPDILPGTTLEGRRLSRVVLHVTPAGLTTEAWAETAPVSTLGDTLLASFSALVRRALRRVDYYAQYASKVIVQNADGTLDLLPDDTRMPSKTRVPIRLGIPGTTVKVSAGARVMLCFENGDPSKPIVTNWEGPGLTEVAFGGGAQPIARQGDTVASFFPAAYEFMAVISPDPTLAPVIPALASVPGGGLVEGAAKVTVRLAPKPLVGTVLSGSPKVKA